MFKILVVAKATEGYCSTKSVSITSEVIEFNTRAEADIAIDKLKSQSIFVNVTKLYNEYPNES